NLPRLWQQHGYTHLHFGVVRIGLTLYARKELPVIARNRLNRLLIKVISTSLHQNGSNDIKCKNDLNLLKTLKVQLQLIGAPMQEKSVVATLHHKIVYRIQDHTLDLITMLLPQSR
ncbi:unnamed protein product, partial [Brassica oleracea var. botrytis]